MSQEKLTNIREVFEQIDHALEYAQELNIQDDEYLEICPSRVQFWKTLKELLQPSADVYKILEFLNSIASHYGDDHGEDFELGFETALKRFESELKDRRATR